MMRFFKRLLKIIAGVVLLLFAAGWFLKWWMDFEPASRRSLAMSPPISARDAALLSVQIDPDFVPASLPPSGEPQHPYLAKDGQSLMHAGGWETDTHKAAGFFASTAQILTRRVGGKAARQCATFTFLKSGHPLILCGGWSSFQLQLLDKDTLERLAFYNLPMRPSSFEAIVKRDISIIFSDTSGGAYFYLDDQDRAVLADSRQHIRRIAPVQVEGEWTFKEAGHWDMRPYVPHDCFHYNNLMTTGECDAITTVMPDHTGLIWWVTRRGRIGSLDPVNGKVTSTDFGGEEVQNAFAVTKEGAYVVTDQAMYHLRLANGMPVQKWRLEYDRGTARKLGSINQGSGTSPTIFGGGKYVSFTDNADERIAIIVAHAGEVPNGQVSDGQVSGEVTRQICRVPVFASGQSATDNSMIGYGRSILLENNYGYTNSLTQKDYSTVTGGVVRIDVREDETGCDIIWESDLVVPSVVPKLSLGNGIAYFYSFDLGAKGERLWSLVGLDFKTGKEVIRVPTGTGEAYNNNWSSLAIAPNGDSYVGTRKGVIKISGVKAR